MHGDSQLAHTGIGFGIWTLSEWRALPAWRQMPSIRYCPHRSISVAPSCYAFSPRSPPLQWCTRQRWSWGLRRIWRPSSVEGRLGRFSRGSLCTGLHLFCSAVRPTALPRCRRRREQQETEKSLIWFTHERRNGHSKATTACAWLRYRGGSSRCYCDRLPYSWRGFNLGSPILALRPSRDGRAACDEKQATEIACGKSICCTSGLSDR